MIQKQKHKNYKQEHDMWKTNLKKKIYYVNICKHECEKKWQSYGVRSCLKLVLNKLKEMKSPIFIYIPLGT